MRYTGGDSATGIATPTHICCQIPSLSPGLGYDQQCYQWFTAILNCFMDTYLSSSADQSNEATRSPAKWSLSDRSMSNPNCIFCHSDVRKSRKQSLYPNLNLDGGETVIKTNDGGFVAWWINEWQDCFLQKEARVCVSNMFRALRPSSSKNTSVRPSVSYHHEIKNFLPMTEVMSMQFKVRGERSRSQRSKPNVAVSGP